MKKRTKRSLAAVLAVLMALSCVAFGMTAFAAEESYTCAHCGTKYTKLDESHDWENHQTNAAFIEEEDWYYTSDCDYGIIWRCTKPGCEHYNIQKFVGDDQTLSYAGTEKYHPYLSVALEDRGVVPATTTKDGYITYKCTDCGEGIPSETIYHAASVGFAQKNYAYNGNKKTPAVVVKNQFDGTISKRDNIFNKDNWSVTYTNNTNIGTATATIKFSHRYKGTVTRTFKIIPAKMAAPTVVNAAKGFKITWKKAGGCVTGYEIWRSKNGGTYQKVKVIASASTTTYTDSSDAANANGVKYAYKIRAYKKGHSYGAFSAAKVSYKVARPAAPTVKNSGSGKISVSWTKNAKASGYKVKYVTGSSTKIAEVKGADTTGITLTVNKKAKYSVYVQAYKTVSGKTYHSCFSPAKTITTT